jgi:hypothetical protein
VLACLRIFGPDPATEVAPTAGTAVQVFATGAIVQVFLLARCVFADS